MIGLDSDCIIDFLKGKKEAIEIVGKHKDALITTEINLFEIYFGIYQKPFINEKEEKSANDFFASIDVLPFDKECGKKAAKTFTSLIKEGKIIEQNDVFVASILLQNKAETIITRNKKHFSKIPLLKVVSY